MDDYVEEYITIRDSLLNQLRSMIEVYSAGMWDPLMRYIIVKELQQLVVTDMSAEFPDFPVQYLPNIKIKFDDDTRFVETGIQVYLNKTGGLIFLGNADHDGIVYDLYCRESWDPNFSHIFYARYGHDENSFDLGSKEPAAEYMLGMMTPLSIAYSYAIEEGYIS